MFQDSLNLQKDAKDFKEEEEEDLAFTSKSPPMLFKPLKPLKEDKEFKEEEEEEEEEEEDLAFTSKSLQCFLNHLNL